MQAGHSRAAIGDDLRVGRVVGCGEWRARGLPVLCCTGGAFGESIWGKMTSGCVAL